MGVDDMVPIVRVTSQMELNDPVTGDAIDKDLRIESMIKRIHINVIHVEENSAICFVRQSREEFTFGECRSLEFEVGGRILERDRTLQKILNDPDTLNRMP